MPHAVYKITNKLNGRYYIGIRTCRDPYNDPNYLGSGKVIRQAVAKYGKEAFVKIILHIFDNFEEALAKEVELVNPEDPKSYNLNKGGFSWYYINTKLPPAALGFGNGGANKGKKYRPKTQEEREAISRALKGKPRPNARKPKSEQHKQRIREGRLKSLVSGRAAIAAALRFECPHCGKKADSGNYRRWHGNNCSARQGSISLSQ